MAEVDDFFGDDQEEDRSLGHEGRAREKLFRSHGYRDGITAGKNDSVQEGFNIGFIDAAKASYRWGQARGIASALAALPSNLSSKLVTSEKMRQDLVVLDMEMQGISSEDAAKLFYVDQIQSSITSKPADLPDNGFCNSNSGSCNCKQGTTDPEVQISNDNACPEKADLGVRLEAKISTLMACLDGSSWKIHDIPPQSMNVLQVDS